jgi:beta-lactamase class A
MKLLLLSLACLGTLAAQTLQETVDQAAASAVATFAARGLKPDRLAITVIDLNERDLNQREHPASYRGGESFYPASVVKLFYLVAAHAAMESGKLQSTPEFERALHDMITTSSNDATQLVFSALTGTTGGPELPEAELQPWMAKREAVNHYFESLGFHGINVNQPTFAESPYGRERQARGPNWENNNRVTTEAVARLWLSIVSRQAVNSVRSDAMLRLLRRDPFAPEPKDEQATDFGSKALPAGSRYWSKAGWTDAVRHDSAWVRLPNGAEYILVAFTRGVSKSVDILPFIHGQIAAYFLKHAPLPDLLLTNGHIWTPRNPGRIASPFAATVSLP